MLTTLNLILHNNFLQTGDVLIFYVTALALKFST